MDTETLYHNLAQEHPDVDADWWPTRSNNEEFEIACGCILTQNTRWENAERAIANLDEHNLLEPERLLDSDIEEHVHPSGFYRQKAARLKRLARYLRATEEPERTELLDIKGVGKETADSILLFAFHRPYFVIDEYTRRVVHEYRVMDSDRSYDELRRAFEDELERDADLYKEFHALIVEQAKTYL